MQERIKVEYEKRNVAKAKPWTRLDPEVKEVVRTACRQEVMSLQLSPDWLEGAVEWRLAQLHKNQKRPQHKDQQTTIAYDPVRHLDKDS